MNIMRLAIFLVGASLVIALSVASAQLTGNLKPLNLSLTGAYWGTQSLPLGLYYDNITALMLVLVTFVGMIVCRFSVRYLDGETTQGQYFKWMMFTIGAVCLMIISGDLLMFFLAWFITSLGLHQLLVHYGHRPLARRAAWTKLMISRFGDGFLFLAVMLIVQAYGTLSVASLFEQAKELATAPHLVTSQHKLIAWFLVIGAAIKSAQVPFHTWLPDTLDTPTPVSALMHAGIVNAGGYLLIRVSPLVSLEPMALSFLAVLGATTACLAGVAMTVQTSVKRSLAYSTVAQMGFMMLQCGLGAFSAAMLHILAHSMYKAYAFLSSGTVDWSSSRSRARDVAAATTYRSFWYLLGSTFASATLFVTVSYLLQLNLSSKQGGYLLSFIMILALSVWCWKLQLGEQLQAKAMGLIVVVGASFMYLASYGLIDVLVGQSISSGPPLSRTQWVSLPIGLAFGSIFLLQIAVTSGWHRPWLERIRIHASNGFYFGSIYQRLFSNVMTS